MSIRGWRAAALVLAPVLTRPPAQAQTVHYEGGVLISSGDYIFTERTTSWTLTNGLALGAGPFTFRATLPLYAQNTSLIAASGAGSIPTGGSASGMVADSAAARGGSGQGGTGQDVTSPSLLFARGPVDVPTTAVTGYEFAVGDPLASVSLALSGSSPVSLILGGGVKVPVSDTSSFGTGEWDYGASLSLLYRMGYTGSLGVALGYWHLGDPPGLELNDPLTGSVSLGYLAPSGWGGLLSVSASTSAISEFAAPVYAGATITRVTSRGIVGLQVSSGLTESAADLMVGLSWRVVLRR